MLLKFRDITHFTEFWPAHCWKKKMKNAMIKRIKFPFPKNAFFSPKPRRASCSSIIAASISAISSKTLSEWMSSLRKYARFSSPSLCRPTEASQRGDSYLKVVILLHWQICLNPWPTLMVNNPMIMIPAGTSWNPKGILHMLAPVEM